MQLTILFEAPYWIGLIEYEQAGLLYVGRHIFGAEPSDAQVYAFVQRDLVPLLHTLTVGLPISTKVSPHPINPKRRQRQMRRELAQMGISTHSQEVMRQQLEANKKMRQTQSKAQKAAEAAHQQAVRVAKAKARRKGTG